MTMYMHSLQCFRRKYLNEQAGLLKNIYIKQFSLRGANFINRTDPVRKQCVCSVVQSWWTLVTPWAAASQAPLSMGFSRQEYRSGLLGPPPGDPPDSGTEPVSLPSPALAGGFFTTSATWEAL